MKNKKMYRPNSSAYFLDQAAQAAQAATISDELYLTNQTMVAMANSHGHRLTPIGDVLGLGDW